MENWTIGQRVKVGSQGGYIYVIEPVWVGIILDKNSYWSNGPIFWAKPDELEKD